MDEGGHPWQFPLSPLRISDAPPRRTGAGLHEHSGNTTEQTQVQQNPHTHTLRGNIFPSDGRPKQIIISSFSKFPCSLFSHSIVSVSPIPPSPPSPLPLHSLTSRPTADSALQPLIRLGRQCPIVFFRRGVADAASTYELGSSPNPPALPGDLMFSSSR